MKHIHRSDYEIPGITSLDGYLVAAQVYLQEVDMWKVGVAPSLDGEGLAMEALADQHAKWFASDKFKQAPTDVKRFAKAEYRREQKRVENRMWWLLVFAQSNECPREWATEILTRLALYGFGGLTGKTLGRLLDEIASS